MWCDIAPLLSHTLRNCFCCKRSCACQHLPKRMPCQAKLFIRRLLWTSTQPGSVQAVQPAARPHGPRKRRLCFSRHLKTIETLQPPVVILENVTGLLKLWHGALESPTRGRLQHTGFWNHQAMHWFLPFRVDVLWCKGPRRDLYGVVIP